MEQIGFERGLEKIRATRSEKDFCHLLLLLFSSDLLMIDYFSLYSYICNDLIPFDRCSNTQIADDAFADHVRITDGFST